MRRLLLYYLAFILAIIEVAMLVSVILTPFVLWLREKSDWFINPFNIVEDVDFAIKTRKVNRALAKAKIRK